MKDFNFKVLGKGNPLVGNYSVTYSPDESAWYAELWWNDEMSPLFNSQAKAAKWAIDNGGKVEHTK